MHQESIAIIAALNQEEGSFVQNQYTMQARNWVLFGAGAFLKI